MTRATDLLKEARAFLDALAVGESGGADDDDAYSILFDGDHFDAPPWPEGFPDWDGVEIGGVMTHAVGRYQFEPDTWRGLGGGPFDPESQDHAAWKLACEVRHNLLIRLQADAMPGIAASLHSTWTSLSEDSFAQRYHAALAAIG